MGGLTRFSSRHVASTTRAPILYEAVVARLPEYQGHPSPGRFLVVGFPLAPVGLRVSGPAESGTGAVGPVGGFMVEIEAEWPELRGLVARARRGEPLSELDEAWLRELSEATGWDSGDILEDLGMAGADPSERVERYRGILEKYLEEAKRHYERGDTRQAAEKLWGAITALVKLYAALKGVPVVHWSRGKMEKVIASNVEGELRGLFLELLDKGSALHEHFYEGHMTRETFEERWRSALHLIEEIRKRLPGNPQKPREPGSKH
ncbi:MAG: PaREP1 family protein [Desulfurococcales archaeon]|nr:PaREP1 family protein [Desulfurococcales archaeon]